MSNTDMLDKSDLDPSALKAVEYASEVRIKFKVMQTSRRFF